MAVGERPYGVPQHEDEVGQGPHESPNGGRIVEARSAEQSVWIKKVTFGDLIINYDSPAKSMVSETVLARVEENILGASS